MNETDVIRADERTRQLAYLAANALADVKAEEIILLDLTRLNTFADFFVIANGSSHIHMKALADRVRETMRKEHAPIHHVEGEDSKTWILLGFDAVVVHIFSRSARDYYGLEQLWGDAKIVDWRDS